MHWATRRPVYAISRIGLHGCTSRRFALGVHASPGPPSFLSMQVVSRLPFMMSSVPDSELGINAQKDLRRSLTDFPAFSAFG